MPCAHAAFAPPAIAPHQPLRAPAVSRRSNCRFRSPAASMCRCAWSEVPGWNDDDHLAAYKTFRASCKPIAAQHDAAGRSEGAWHVAARALPHRAGPRNFRRRRRPRPSSSNISCRCASRGSARTTASSPAITSRSSRARGPRTRSTTCRSIAGPPICSCAAPSRPRPACRTRARCSARSAAASSCPITIAARSRTVRSTAAASKSAG